MNGAVMLKPNAWLGQIKASAGYSDESIAGELPTSMVANKAMLGARMALQKITEGLAASDDVDSHDMLAHCIGIAQVRIHDIGGVDANNVMTDLNAGAKALNRAKQRWQQTGKWGLDGPGIYELRIALEIYEVVLRSSSPQLMENAQNFRLEKLKKLQPA